MAVTQADLIKAVAAQIDDVLADASDVTVHVVAGLFVAAEKPSINVYQAPPGLPIELAGFGERYGGYHMNIKAVVNPADIDAGEELLWGFTDDDADPLSIIAALDFDRTLNGIADTLMWGEWSGYQDFSPETEPGKFVGATLPLIVAKAHS